MTSEELSSSSCLDFTRMGLCKLPCAVLLALPDGSAHQPCQQFWYDLLQNREIPCENQITQTTATFSESHQKSRPGHGELRVTVNFCSQPKSSDPSRQQRKSWAGTGRSGWRGELPGWAAPGEHRVAGSAVGHSRVAGPIPVQRSGLTGASISEESRSAPRLRPSRRSPRFPAHGRSLSGGGARGKRNSAGRSAPPRGRVGPWLPRWTWSGSWEPWTWAALAACSTSRSPCGSRAAATASAGSASSSTARGGSAPAARSAGKASSWRTCGPTGNWPLWWA